MSTSAGNRVEAALADQEITGRILLIRGQRVMLDRYLAELYEVETKHLKRQVQRNILRFPKDFMFILTAKELAALRYQFGTSNDLRASERGGSRVLPMAFTEQGIAMLSGVLNSERAIQVNIRIIRVFTRMRELLATHQDILHKLERIEAKVAAHDEEIGTLFDHIREMLTPAPEQPRSHSAIAGYGDGAPRIGYKNDER